MKILVAGGAGYIGSMLVPALLAHEYEVVVVDSFWFGDYLPKEGCTKINQNLFDCVEEDFKGVDQVIYLGGLSNDPSAEFDPVRNFIYNAALPSYLAYLAKRAGVKKYIYASTCSVYRYSKNELYNEESKISCNYPYGVGKLQGEKGVMHLNDSVGDGDFRVICLRKGTVSGSSPRMRFDLIVNTMFKSAITTGMINISNPAIWRPIVSTQDVVSAYLRSIQADHTVSGVFNIAHDNYTVGSVAEIVRDVVSDRMGKSASLKIHNVKDVRNYKVCIDKARTVLGFHPRYSVESIANDLANNWIKFEGDIEDDKYYNINVCKRVFEERLRLV